jgi:hypothetical protein
VGRASAILSRRRLAAFVALGAAVGAYYVWRRSLPNIPFWWDITLLVFPIIPAVLALVWIFLPLWRSPSVVLLGGAVALGLVAAGCDHQGWYLAGNFAKLFAPALVGWWFLRFFETEAWVVIVACLIPFVDSYSVWRGPTHHIVTHQQSVFTSLSFAFPVPAAGAARLGLPDILFFALFLAAADRFELRVPLTFALSALSFGATVVIANAFDLSGLPALPLLSVAFLLANGDLLWRRSRRQRKAAGRASPVADE